MDGNNIYDPMQAGAIQASAAAAGERFRERLKTARLAYDNSQLTRMVGACEAVQVVGSDPEFRRLMHPDNWGYRQVVKTPSGGGDTMVELVSDNNNNNFSVPGSTMIAQRANAFAGGISAVESLATNPYSPRQTLVGGSVKFDNRYAYAVAATKDGNTEIIKVVVTTSNCVNAAVASVQSSFEPLGYSDFQARRIGGGEGLPSVDKIDFDCG